MQRLRVRPIVRFVLSAIFAIAFALSTTSAHSTGPTLGWSQESTSEEATPTPTPDPELDPIAYLEVVHEDGFRAELLLVVYPPQDLELLPERCPNSYDQYHIFRMSYVRLFLYSVEVNGFDWPIEKVLSVNLLGWLPCGSTGGSAPMSTFFAGRENAGAVEFAYIFAERNPNYPDGDWSERDWSPLSLAVGGEDEIKITEESCKGSENKVIETEYHDSGECVITFLRTES